VGREDEHEREGRRESATSAGPARDVLLAARAFSAASDRMMGALKDAMRMNATDLAALRLLIIREDRGLPASPRDIAGHLRISTASTSALIDRLAAAGHVRREPDPRDGRGRLVALTRASREEFVRRFGAELAAMRRALEAFTPAELAAAARVIGAMSAAIDPES